MEIPTNDVFKFTPELEARRQALLAENDAHFQTGELDGLEELRSEVANDPESLRAYLAACERTQEYI